MKTSVLFILFVHFTFQLSVSAQTSDFKIKGIGIGSSNSTLFKRLGRPLSSKEGGIVPCSDGSKLLTLKYQGLVIELSNNSNERNFTVFSINVTSQNWLISGIRIGSSLNNVKAKLGQPYHQTTESGLQGLHYNNNKGIDGAASFYFQNKKLKKVELYLNYC
jgi:hypothetical protein